MSASWTDKACSRCAAGVELISSHEKIQDDENLVQVVSFYTNPFALHSSRRGIVIVWVKW